MKNMLCIEQSTLCISEEFYKQLWLDALKKALMEAEKNVSAMDDADEYLKQRIRFLKHQVSPKSDNFLSKLICKFASLLLCLFV